QALEIGERQFLAPAIAATVVPGQLPEHVVHSGLATLEGQRRDDLARALIPDEGLDQRLAAATEQPADVVDLVAMDHHAELAQVIAQLPASTTSGLVDQQQA